MRFRFSRSLTILLVVAVMLLMAQRSWAVRYPLGPSKDEWKLKYDVTVQEAEGDKLTVVFTIADEGRLKPIYSFDVMAFSKPDASGGRTYDLNVPIELKPTPDGKRQGTVQIPKKHLDRANIRLITLTFDGKRRAPNAGLCYDIPLAKYLNKAPAEGASAASSP